MDPRFLSLAHKQKNGRKLSHPVCQQVYYSPYSPSRTKNTDHIQKLPNSALRGTKVYTSAIHTTYLRLLFLPARTPCMHASAMAHSFGSFGHFGAGEEVQSQPPFSFPPCSRPPHPAAAVHRRRIPSPWRPRPRPRSARRASRPRPRP